MPCSQVFLDGKCLGGATDLKTLRDNGTLVKLLSHAAASPLPPDLQTAVNDAQAQRQVGIHETWGDDVMYGVHKLSILLLRQCGRELVSRSHFLVFHLCRLPPLDCPSCTCTAEPSLMLLTFIVVSTSSQVVEC